MCAVRGIGQIRTAPCLCLEALDLTVTGQAQGNSLQRSIVWPVCDITFPVQPLARLSAQARVGRLISKEGLPSRQGRVPDIGHTASNSPASCQYCEACPLGHFARSLLKEASPQSHAGILNITRRQSSFACAGQVHANQVFAAACRQGSEVSRLA